MSNAVLKLTGLSRSFGGLAAVDGVSLEARRNRITTVIGPNGAGKSTLFNLISGALSPDQGTIEIDGEDVTRLGAHLRQRAGLARSFQITNLFADLTVAENIRLAAQALEPNRKFLQSIRRSTRATEKVAEVIERFEFEVKANEMAGNLSHGEQRRLEVAMCLASQPKVLLLDEPTQGMSHQDTQDTGRLIRELARDVTVLLVEHDIGLVMDLSDHVVVMHQGRKLAEGDPQAVRNNKAVQAAYFGHH